MHLHHDGFYYASTLPHPSCLLFGTVIVSTAMLLLLSTEVNSFCCGNGTRALPALHPLPHCMHAMLNDLTHLRHIIEFCRVINNFFSFTGIGVSRGFQHFHSGAGAGPPAVVITGQTYHLVRNTEYKDHSIHWFLYDE